MTLKPISYLINEDNFIKVEYRGKDKWAITNSDLVLNKHNEWEYEPLPSSRTDEFIQRTRFDSAHAALEFYEQFSKKDHLFDKQS